MNDAYDIPIVMDCPVCLNEFEVAPGVEVAECPHCDTTVAVSNEEEALIGV